jgi:acyl-CoA thioesterase FadM
LGELCCKGSVVIVYYDWATEKSTPVPEKYRELLAQHLRTNP